MSYTSSCIAGRFDTKAEICRSMTRLRKAGYKAQVRRWQRVAHADVQLLGLNV